MDSAPTLAPTGNAELDAFARMHFLFTRDVYQTFCNTVVNELKSEVGYLHLYDEANAELELVVFSDRVFEQCTTLHRSHYPLRSAGVWADCVRQKRVVVHNDYQTAASAQGLPAGHFPIFRHISAPVRHNGNIVAVIGVGNRQEPYTDGDAAHLFEFVKLGWSLVEGRIAELLDRETGLKTAFADNSPDEVLLSMLSAVCRSLELKDECTSQHQSNVAYICERIGDMLELMENQAFGLRVGALVHDIGKIAIPSKCLAKTGKLFPAEFDMIKMHPTLGANIFRGIDLPWPVVDMVEQHHERMDGSGYPSGLSSHDICLEARIIGVADTFDAMASDRPYRRAPGRNAAIAVIREGRGKQFDPYVVDALLACLQEDPVLRPGQRYH